MDENVEINRINEVYKYSKLKQGEFADKIGVSMTFLSEVLNGKKGAGLNVIQGILFAFVDISPSWLLTGTGEMIQNSSSNAKEKNINTYMNVPLVPIRGKAGYLTGFGDMEYIESLPTLPVIVDREYKGKYRCFEVEGDSMDDDSRGSICDRDIVLGREIKRELWRCKLHIRDWNFIIVHKDGISIKSIVEHDVERGIIRCHSKNNFYEDFYLNLDDVIELYNLIKIVDRNTRY